MRTPLSRRLRRTVGAPLCLCAAAGCTSALPPATEPMQALAARQELDEMKEERNRDTARIQELESRLSLARAEADDLRDELSERDVMRPRHRPAVRIGAASPERDWREPWQEGVWQDPSLFEETEPEPSDRGPRPVLRLYGERPGRSLAPPAASSTLPPLDLPAAPSPSAARLTVVPLPGEAHVRSAASPVRPVALPIAGPASGAGRPPFLPSSGAVSANATQTEYQGALALVRDRRFNEALTALDGFIDRHSDHPYVQNAIYWRGEVYYALRSYRLAQAEFETVVERFPGGSKAADALLKAGLCRLRSGDRHDAERVFERVRREYPESVAAQMATREQDGDLR